MVKDPDHENSKFQQYLARLHQLLQSRFSTAIILATAVVTVVAVVVFAKALPRRSRSTLTRSDLARTQSIAQLPAQESEVQQSQNQIPTAAPTKEIREIRPGDDARSTQGSASLRSLSALDQEVTQIKQAQEQQARPGTSVLDERRQGAPRRRMVKYGARASAVYPQKWRLRLGTPWSFHLEYCQPCASCSPRHVFLGL